MSNSMNPDVLAKMFVEERYMKKNGDGSECKRRCGMSSVREARLEAALSYVQAGWPVLPLWSVDEEGKCTCGKSDCRHPGKHPQGHLAPHGLNDATVDEATVERWFGANDLNIGVCTGSESGLLVLDVDPRHGGDKSLEALEKKHGPLPMSRKAKTGGGGWHLYLKYPDDDVRNSASSLGAGLDIRGKGGYVIAPPSRHMSGDVYEWDGDPTTPLAECPNWMYNGHTKKKQQQKEPGDAIPEGDRNSTLTSIAGSMRRKGCGQEAIYAALSEENKKRCKPPLADSEVKRIAESICRYKPGDVPKAATPEHPEEPIDTSQFKPMSSEELIETLGLTIKRDDANKLITFLCELSVYTESCQFNISYNAPSSTGKSYIPMEIARLFPQEDVIELAYASPTAFFHDAGEYNEEKGGYVVDLSRKILIFMDQPHNDLLSRLRPLLSHDKKEIVLKITDKRQHSGLRTKTIILIGYPAVIFCTAGMKVDEQESTRMLMLSPETTQEKLREAICAKIKKGVNLESYQEWLENDPNRQLLRQRIKAIRQENIGSIKIANEELVREQFFKNCNKLKPRNQRDIGHVMSLIKAFALLNVWFRENNGTTIIADDSDIADGFELWEHIAESQDLSLPPYICKLYHEIIVPAYHEKNGDLSEHLTTEMIAKGLTRSEIMGKHIDVYGRSIQDWKLRQEILPMLEGAGLIKQDPDPDDGRRLLVYPLVGLTVSDKAQAGTDDDFDIADF